MRTEYTAWSDQNKRDLKEGLIAGLSISQLSTQLSRTHHAILSAIYRFNYGKYQKTSKAGSLMAIYKKGDAIISCSIENEDAAKSLMLAEGVSDMTIVREEYKLSLNFSKI